VSIRTGLGGDECGEVRCKKASLENALVGSAQVQTEDIIKEVSVHSTTLNAGRSAIEAKRWSKRAEKIRREPD